MPHTTFRGNDAHTKENKMTTLTANQSKALVTLIKSCLSNMGGETLSDLQDDPHTWVDVEDLVDAGWGKHEAQGTFASLAAEGFIDHMDDGDWALNEDWDKLAKYHA